jgi:hypothetical protein
MGMVPRELREHWDFESTSEERAMNLRRRFLCGSLAIGGAVWAASAFLAPRFSERAALSSGEEEAIRVLPVEHVQFHLIPRTQPTPASPTHQGAPSPKLGISR